MSASAELAAYAAANAYAAAGIPVAPVGAGAGAGVGVVGAAAVKAEKKRRGGKTGGAGVGRWTEEEEKQLTAALKEHGDKAWKKVAACVPNRTEIQCLQHHKQVMNRGSIKRGRGSWTPEDDARLIALVAEHGTKKWASAIAPLMDGRMGKQCRERWVNKLNPALKKGPWSVEEEQTLDNLQQELGNKWATIANRMGNTRSENDVKNHYYAKKRRKGPGHAAKRRKKEAEGTYVPPAPKPRAVPRAPPMPLPVVTPIDNSAANEAVNV